MTTTTSKILQQGLSRYRIIQKIGAGGMATVYRAHDEALHRDVALKILHEHLLSSADAIKRFTNEARAVASLSHENVIKVFDCGEIEDRPFLVMEYLEGSPLTALIEKYGTLPNLAALAVCRQILLGLIAAHAKGIFHRDIKPDNIMIDTAGTAKIMDFGIAYIVNGESLTLTGSFIGSPRFISPEQAEGRPLTGGTDIFSLGVLLYYTLCGGLPFEADMAAAVVHAIIHDAPEPLFKRNGKTLFWLSDFVDACLIKDPAGRPDAADALRRLDRDLLLHELTAGKELVRNFLADPAGVREYETKKLYEHYRTRARASAKGRAIGPALKSLEQARAFGPLLPEDEKIISRHLLKRQIMKVAAAAALLALTVAAAVWLWNMPPRQEAGTGTVPASAAAVPPETAAPAVQQPEQAPPPPAEQKQQEKAAGTRQTAVSHPPLSKKIVSTAPAKKDTPVQSVPGYVLIRTNPPWAKVYIDEIDRGTTPAKTVFSALSGTHEIRIVKEGFLEHRKTVSVNGPDTLRLKILLSPASSPAR